jgi:tetratricopeptide (TPR) repeat protein
MYKAIVATRIDRQTLERSRVPRDQILTYSVQLQDLTASTADRYGGASQQLISDGAVALFGNADAAVQFGLRLITTWDGLIVENGDAGTKPQLQVAVHFGDCVQVGNRGAWHGHAIDLASGMADVAEANTVFVSETVLDLVDTPLYDFDSVGSYPIAGDRVPERTLFRIIQHRSGATDARPENDMSADDWLLRAAAMAGTPEEDSDTELACYREALRLSPDLPTAHNNLAVILSARNEISAATGHYQSAIRLRPDYREAHYNYAVLLNRRGSRTGASEHFLSALEHRPRYADAHYAYASLLHQSDRVQEAETHYTSALELRPDHREAHNNLAVILQFTGNDEAAATHYAETLRLRPDDPEAHYNYGLLLKGTGNPQAEGHLKLA